MSISQTSILTIISENASKFIYSNDDEFHNWAIMQSLVKNNEFRDDDIETVLKHYQPIENDKSFLDLQLKLFLIRNSKNANIFTNNLIDLIDYWTTEILNKYSGGTPKMILNFLDLLDSSRIKNKYGKYYYRVDVYQKYIENWNNSTVDLNTWKKFQYLSLPGDFNFMNLLFTKQGINFTFPQSYMKKLFEEYTNEIYTRQFKPRLEKSILVKREKAILTRLLENTASKSDIENINSIFFPNAPLKLNAGNISRCLVDELYYSEMDINSRSNFARCCALIKYYDVISEIPKDSTKVKPKNYAVWFKNTTIKEKKIEVYEQLKIVFEQIQYNCPNNTWNDFKSIFNINGSSVRIEWNGDADIINYLFRKLHKVLLFKGEKWKVIASYFYKVDETDKTLDAKNLASNTHFKESNNPKFVKHLKDLISTLG